MGSHHFIGTGALSPALRREAAAPELLLGRIATLVAASGLEVVARQAVPFDNGGVTLVWVLAESHLVLHVWEQEEFATVDLHVCDFHADNADRARELARELEALCFARGSEQWQELHLEHPAPAHP